MSCLHIEVFGRLLQLRYLNHISPFLKIATLQQLSNARMQKGHFAPICTLYVMLSRALLEMQKIKIKKKIIAEAAGKFLRQSMRARVRSDSRRRTRTGSRVAMGLE